MFVSTCQICDTCEWTTGEDGNLTLTDKSHPGFMAVDGDETTWWQSPPISRGLKYNRVTLDIDLQQVTQKALRHVLTSC